MTDRSNWREERSEALAAQAAALERRKAAETAQARELIAEFVREMQQGGRAPGPLRARVPHSRTTYRTGITGWYIRRNRSLGVGVDGAYYILDVPASFTARLKGVALHPVDPPLIVGVGARDGESMPLDELLRRRLEDPPGEF